ncbi:MAG: 50S ribosomal protein L22 [Candidatus Micrarchaeota archaeon]
MKSYSYNFDNENFVCARIEGVDASYKDLTEVCGRIRNKKISVALDLLQKASNMEIPILYKRHSKRLGHRRELGGQKGRYPQKSAKIVLKVLKSAIANGNLKGFDEMVIAHVAANKKIVYPRLASKGRQSRSNFELSRVEIVLKNTGAIVKKEIKKPVPVVQKPNEVHEHKPGEVHEHKHEEVHKHEEKKTEKPVEAKKEVAKPVKDPTESKKKEKPKASV